MTKTKAKYTLGTAFIVFLLASVFFVRLSMLHKSHEPNGLDGYFYALQARSFIETGHLENPSHEPGYYLCGICSFFTDTPINGVKFWSALSATLTCLAVFLLLFALTKHFLASTLGFLLTASSPTFASMSINFINNQTGICFLLLYVFFLIKLLQSFSFKHLLPAVTFLALSMISHKVTLLYAVAVTCIVLLPYIKQTFVSFYQKCNTWNTLYKVFILLAITIIFITGCIITYLFFARHSPRFVHAFALPSLPFIHHKRLSMSVTTFGTYEITFYFVILYILGCITFAKKLHRTLALLIPALFFPMLNLDSDMGVRLFMNAVPLCIPLFVFELYLVFSSIITKKGSIACGIFACLLLYVGLFLTPHVYNPKKDPPYSYYRQIVSKVTLADDTLLIAHLGLNHVYTYYNGLKDALNWLPDFAIPVEKTWRLCYGANENRIRDMLQKTDTDLISTIDRNYILLREDLWQQYLAIEDTDIAETYKNWYNPYQVRPAYIRKLKKQKRATGE
ncbi:MAG: hypothetical protein K6E51_00530 [Treponema sp.]|nr:hypothetical protein [Treponema sp.]